MTMDSDRHITEVDNTMNIAGIVVVLVGIVAAIWYFAG